MMLEWLKRHAWKACIRQKRIASSNLAHSANKTLKINSIFAGFSGFIFTFIGKPIVVILAKSGDIQGNFGAKCFSYVSPKNI